VAALLMMTQARSWSNVEIRDTGETGLERPHLLAPFKTVAALSAALILIQALLAGRGWFVDMDLIETHGWVGNITFLAIVVQAGLAFALGLPARERVVLLGINALLVILVFGQIGLGYGTRESAEAASWHIPLGVFLFGVTTYHLALTTRLRS
jgi:hypothetical protein